MAKNVKVLKHKWVLSIKGVYNLYKARLSAEGFTQHFGEDYDETFATMAKYTSICTLFELFVARISGSTRWTSIKPCSIESSMISSMSIRERRIRCSWEDYVCLVRKLLYGLKPSPRVWLQLIVTLLVDFDFQ